MIKKFLWIGTRAYQRPPPIQFSAEEEENKRDNDAAKDAEMRKKNFRAGAHCFAKFRTKEERWDGVIVVLVDKDDGGGWVGLGSNV